MPVIENIFGPLRIKNLPIFMSITKLIAFSVLFVVVEKGLDQFTGLLILSPLQVLINCIINVQYITAGALKL